MLTISLKRLPFGCSHLGAITCVVMMSSSTPTLRVISEPPAEGCRPRTRWHSPTPRTHLPGIRGAVAIFRMWLVSTPGWAVCEGPRFAINTYALRDQRYPAATATAHRSFLILRPAQWDGRQDSLGWSAVRESPRGPARLQLRWFATSKKEEWI